MILSNKAPIITVIVAVRNMAETMQDCIDSIMRQTYENKELIIIDGKSTDGTWDVIKKYRSNIKYSISESDSGIYNAWNKALRVSSGDWIYFMGADDYFYEDRVLEKLAEKLLIVPKEINLAYSKAMLVGLNKSEIFSVGESWSQIKKPFLNGVCFCHQSVIHRRSFFIKNGKFDESFKIAGDYEVLLRELSKNDAYFIPEITMVCMRQGLGLSSAIESAMIAIWEIRRAQIINGYYFPSIIWLASLFKLYVRLIALKVLSPRVCNVIFDYLRRIRGLPPYWTKIEQPNK